MKHFLRLFSLMAFLWAGVSLHAQEETDFMVIARSGVNLRSEPSLTGKKLITIPFGAKVQTLSPTDFYYEEDPDTVRIDGILGKWVEVKYSGKQGWVFSGYLYFYGKGYEKEMFASNQVLLYANGASCNTPFLNWNKVPNTYGIFDLKNGKMEIRPVRMSYSCVNIGLGPWLQFESDSKDTALYYLFTPQPWKTGEIRANSLIWSEESTWYYSGNRDYFNRGWNFHFRRENETEDTTALRRVTLEMNGVKQVLFEEKPRGENDPAWDSVWLDWVGDLDGDGKMDLVWAKGRYYAAEVELWLSSLAKPGQLVGKAMMLFESGCC